MALEDVQAQVTKGDRAGEIYTAKVDLPQNLDEAKTKYGEDVVFSRFMSSLVIDVQSCMRRAINKDGATTETVQKAAQEYTPQVRQPAKTIAERAADLISRLNEDEREQLLQQLIGQ